MQFYFTHSLQNILISLIFLEHICHLDGFVKQRAPPNLQGNFDLLCQNVLMLLQRFSS